uniref:Cilia- and flagella-associated protein 53 n=1 Tax=Noctiluca scintillans TaxID=2966 RepID=A0A7S1FAR9_NOCSC
MAVTLRHRTDRAIIQRQKAERKYEDLTAQGIDQFKVGQKAVWENRTDAVLRSHAVKSKVTVMKHNQRASLNERRQRLASMLSAEQHAYEQEMVDMEELPAQRVEKMAARAFELKKKREDERQAFVKQKLQQQWRAGADLRALDSKVTQLSTIVDRDHQLVEKQAREACAQENDKVFDQLWHEGYLAKVDREERERQLREERAEEQKRVLAVQLDLKQRRVEEEQKQDEAQAAETKRLYSRQEVEEREIQLRDKMWAKEARQQADSYMVIQARERAEAALEEKCADMMYINEVVDRERAMSQRERMERQEERRRAIEYNEAVKLERARRADNEEQLNQLQAEEAERQWGRKYKQMEKEELARRGLMEEVYRDRSAQVTFKQTFRDKLKQDVRDERARTEAEVSRLEQLDKEREEAEANVRKQHAEELCKAMDYRQAQRQREQQQLAIEKRQALIAEDKMRRGLKVETAKAESFMLEAMSKRERQAQLYREVFAPSPVSDRGSVRSNADVTLRVSSGAGTPVKAASVKVTAPWDR